MLEIIWMESQYKPLWFSRMYSSIPALDSSLGSCNFDYWWSTATAAVHIILHQPAIHGTNQSHLCFQWQISNFVGTYTTQVSAIPSNNFLVCQKSGDLRHSIGPSLFHLSSYQDLIYLTFIDIWLHRLVLKTAKMILMNACIHYDLVLFLWCSGSMGKVCRSKRISICIY
jgi:hypothetical protein